VIVILLFDLLRGLRGGARLSRLHSESPIFVRACLIASAHRTVPGFAREALEKMRGRGAPQGATTYVTRHCLAAPAGCAPVLWALALRRSTCGFSVPGAVLPGWHGGSTPFIRPAFARLHARRVQPFKADLHSEAGRLPEASRARGYEPRPQAPPLPHVQRASAERPSLGEGKPRYICL
jgi:hypothetical protein